MWRGSGGIDFIAETWRSGDSWYRKWDSGWVEQGGVVFPVSMDTTLNLFVIMANTNCSAIMIPHINEQANSGREASRIRQQLTTQLRAGGESHIDHTVIWQVTGLGA